MVLPLTLMRYAGLVENDNTGLFNYYINACIIEYFKAKIK